VFVTKFLLRKERKKWNKVVEISNLEKMGDVERFCEEGMEHMFKKRGYQALGNEQLTR
jgi:hypothetical protein